MSLFGAGIQGQIYGYGLNPAGAIALLVIRCIPCVSVTSLVPAIAVLSQHPSVAVTELLPLISVSSFAASLVIVALLAKIDLSSITPSLDVEDCNCGK